MGGEEEEEEGRVPSSWSILPTLGRRTPGTAGGLQLLFSLQPIKTTEHTPCQTSPGILGYWDISDFGDFCPKFCLFLLWRLWIAVDHCAQPAAQVEGMLSSEVAQNAHREVSAQKPGLPKLM